MRNLSHLWMCVFCALLKAQPKITALLHHIFYLLLSPSLPSSLQLKVVQYRKCCDHYMHKILEVNTNTPFLLRFDRRSREIKDFKKAKQV